MRRGQIRHSTVLLWNSRPWVPKAAAGNGERWDRKGGQTAGHQGTDSSHPLDDGSC